jgi:hypothetical protein
MLGTKDLWPVPIVICTAVLSAWCHSSRRPSPTSATDDAVAWVGSTAITRSDFNTAIRDVAVDLEPVEREGTRREVLDKLISEELIFQYGMRHQIYRTDSYLRLRVVRTILSFACGSSSTKGPGLKMPMSGEDCLKLGGADAHRTIDEYVRWLRARADISEASLP